MEEQVSLTPASVSRRPAAVYIMVVVGPYNIWSSYDGIAVGVTSLIY